MTTDEEDPRPVEVTNPADTTGEPSSLMAYGVNDIDTNRTHADLANDLGIVVCDLEEAGRDWVIGPAFGLLDYAHGPPEVVAALIREFRRKV